jgi:transposase
MSNLFYHLTDNQWKKIEFFFPIRRRKGRPPLNPRVVLNGILWILRSGARWRDLPPCFGNWNSVYHKFRQWIRGGLFEKILRALNFATNKYLLVQIDSTFCKVHKHGLGALKRNSTQAIGKSRGGYNTKIHALVNEYFQLIGVVLTGGQIHDSECAIKLLSTVNLDGKTVLADKAFNSEKIRAFIQEQGATVCVPDKSNAVIKHDFDAELYKQRNIVERFFQRIKEFRHIAIRYDKLDICFLNFVFLAAFFRYL